MAMKTGYSRLALIVLLSAGTTILAEESDDLLAKANGGDPVAQYEIGRKFAAGDGVSQNMEQAVKWLTMSAQQGNPDAQMGLGALYVSGRAVPRNSAEAAKWYRLAAGQGQAAAQLQMARMHLAGAGVPKDDVEAAKWATLALAQGEEQAGRILTMLRSRMTAEDIDRSGELVRGFSVEKATDNAASGVPLVAPPIEPAE
jgi:hypothetical protein